MDIGIVAARVDALVPDAVRQVCAQLVDAGHEAWTVGGAVRDAALGRNPGDWDIATSALPEAVVALFPKTIPTGLQHGTVTVVIGRGRQRHAIEVTTFRGDGAYTDGRHPDSVRFGVPLQEDLARRDFVINAMAFDPIARQVADPFGGLADLAARVVRAVGQPEVRFAEDGLRVMRAIRFAAVLGFALDPATEAAISTALTSLAKVSAERVREELYKTLAAPRPSIGLALARSTDILQHVLPQLAALDTAAWTTTLARVDAASAAASLRMAALCYALGPDAAEAAARRLKVSNADRELVVALATAAPEWQTLPSSAGDLRRWLAQLRRDRIPALLALWDAVAASEGHPAALRDASARVAAILAAGDPLTTRELAIGGGDIIAALAIPAGPAVGRILAALLERVFDEPAANQPDQLLRWAAELA